MLIINRLNLVRQSQRPLQMNLGKADGTRTHCRGGEWTSPYIRARLMRYKETPFGGGTDGVSKANTWA